MDSVRIKPLTQTGEHSYHRRAFKHDYYAPFIYHIILKKAKECESFGSVIGNARIAPGLPGCAGIKETELGKTIARSILNLPHEHPAIKPYQFRVMPDHVHILLQVLFRSDKHLDFYIAALRKRIATRYSKIKGEPIADKEIFEPGYCDKPLLLKRSLDALYRYIRENPHRLAMRQQYPDFFRRIRALPIAGEEYAAYGNLFLFRNPDKEAVKISRSFSNEELLDKRGAWLSGSSRGTVLVSPFISPAEKEIRSEAEALGGGIILIVHEELPARFKPAAHDFALCAEGRLLIISLGLPAAAKLTRPICERMNALAQTIAQL